MSPYRLRQHAKRTRDIRVVLFRYICQLKFVEELNENYEFYENCKNYENCEKSQFSWDLQLS